MNARLKRLLWFGVSTAILAAMIYFADVRQFLDSLALANPLLLFFALLAGLAVLPILSYVWLRVFRKSGIKIGFFRGLEIFLAGYFMNAITPLGQFGGEPVMAYILKENTGVSYERAISSVFSADVINGIPILTVTLGGVIYAAFFRSINDIVIEGLYIGLFVVGVGLPLMYLLWFQSGTIERALARFAEALTAVGIKRKWVEEFEERLDRVSSSFEAIGEDRAYLFKTIGIAHLYFFCQVLCLFFILWAVGVEPDFTPIYFVLAVSAIANFSPTPGGSGTFEAAMAGLVTVFFPVSLAVGLTVGILFRLTTYWPGLILGYVALARLGATE